MKKVLLSLIILASVAFANKAQAQTHTNSRISFYYYPQANVYYNPQTRQYAYDDHGTWTYHRNLPSNMAVQRKSYVTVYGNNSEIWRDNTSHREKYKNWKYKSKKTHH
jgi:hypothetical protein